MYDLKIVGGTLVDGTGKDRYPGDVGIKDGKIVAVGKCDESAAETFDADGAIVAPGFVDIHTHYDGQISWDEELAPSSIHGVTTCAMGQLRGRLRSGAPHRPREADRADGRASKISRALHCPKGSAGAGRVSQSTWMSSTECRTRSTSLHTSLTMPFACT